MPVRVRCIDGCVADGYIDENGTVMLYDDEYNDITEGGVFYTLKLHASAKTIHLGRIYNAEPDNSIELKIDGGGNLEFRDKIIYNGASYVPIGAVGELALINTAPGGLSGTYLQTHNLNMLGAQKGVNSIFAPVPYNWEPVGTLGSPFEGVFDGGGKDIENLYIHKPDEDYTGLFGVVGEDGLISGVCIRSGIVTGCVLVGSVAGISYGKIEHCCNYGTIVGRYTVGGIAGNNREGTVTASCNAGKIAADVDYAGGIAGFNLYGTITASYNTGEISAGTSKAGGVTGDTREGAITACYNTGEISAGADKAGGVVGDNHYGTVTACYNTGKISADGDYAGGVVGINGGETTACYNTGKIAAGGSYAGGVVGKNGYGTVTACRNGETITACYNTGRVSAGDNYAGGIAGCNCDGTITACYNTGEISAGGSYAGGVVGDRDKEGIIDCYRSGTVTAKTLWYVGREFSAAAWPSSKQSNQWGTGRADGTPGNYWKSLGHWGGAPADANTDAAQADFLNFDASPSGNTDTTVYPVLWWE